MSIVQLFVTPCETEIVKPRDNFICSDCVGPYFYILRNVAAGITTIPREKALSLICNYAVVVRDFHFMAAYKD